MMLSLRSAMHAVMCNLCRRNNLIILLCLFLIRVDHGLFWAQAYVPPSNRILHIPISTNNNQD